MHQYDALFLFFGETSMRWSWLDLKEKYEWLDNCMKIHNAKDVEFWCKDDIAFIVKEWRRIILLDNRWKWDSEWWVDFDKWKEEYYGIEIKRRLEALDIAVKYRSHIGLHLNSVVEEWIEAEFQCTKETIPVKIELITVDFVGAFRGRINWERKL